MNKKHVLNTVMSIAAANSLAACNAPMNTPDLKNDQAMVEKAEKKIKRHAGKIHNEIKIIVTPGTKVLIGPDGTISGVYDNEGSKISSGQQSIYGSYGNYRNPEGSRVMNEGSRISSGSQNIYGSYGNYNSSEGSRISSEGSRLEGSRL